MNKFNSLKEKKIYFKSKINILEKRYRYHFSKDELNIWFNFFEELQDGFEMFEDILKMVYENMIFMPTIAEIENKEIVDYSFGKKTSKRSILEIAKRNLIEKRRKNDKYRNRI